MDFDLTSHKDVAAYSRSHFTEGEVMEMAKAAVTQSASREKVTHNNALTGKNIYHQIGRREGDLTKRRIL